MDQGYLYAKYLKMSHIKTNIVNNAFVYMQQVGPYSKVKFYKLILTHI